MNRAHSVIAGACSWLAGHTGALIIGLAVVWMTASPRPMWGQWSGTNPVWTNSNVGIGTTNPQYKLAVNGNIGAQDIIVTNTGWSDYVSRPGYRLRPLSEVSQFIQANGHLPEIPTEAEVKEKGVSLGDMQAKLLAKVEELTLHAIQQEKESRELRENLTRENQELRDRLARLEKGAASITTTAAK